MSNTWISDSINDNRGIQCRPILLKARPELRIKDSCAVFKFYDFYGICTGNYIAGSRYSQNARYRSFVLETKARGKSGSFRKIQKKERTGELEEAAGCASVLLSLFLSLSLSFSFVDEEIL